MIYLRPSQYAQRIVKVKPREMRLWCAKGQGDKDITISDTITPSIEVQGPIMRS
jgi:hypothetical protein